MIRNKRGLSEIVTTVIIVLLVLVAIGILWAVVGSMLEGNVESIDLNSKCLNVNLKVTKLEQTTPAGNYSATITRTGSGTGNVGLKIIAFNATANSEPVTFASGITFAPLSIHTGTLDTIKPDGSSWVANAKKLQITPYFVGESGEQQLCQQSQTFEF